MCFCKRLWTSIMQRVADNPSTTTESPQTTSNTPAFLHASIPTEIYLLIGTYLPPSSLAALALTTKRLLHIYGSKHWTALKTQPTELADFLLLLERDLVEYYYSSPILRRRIPDSTPRNYTRRNAKDSTYAVLSERFGYTIAWSHVLLALKRHAYGGDHGIPLNAFEHSTSTTSGEHTIHLSTNARIVANRLLLRCTYIISHPHDIKLGDLVALDLVLCRHIHGVWRNSPWYDNTFAQRLSVRRYGESDSEEDIDQLLNPGNARRRLRGQCMFCMTDWCAEMDDEGSYVVTTWQNLGNGVPRDPSNGVWQALAGFPAGFMWLCRVLNYPGGCVRGPFERGGGERLAGIEARM